MNQQRINSVVIAIVIVLIGADTQLQAQKLSRHRSRKTKSSISRPPETHKDEGLPNGKLIRFDDGGTLHVDEAWWRGEEVWYRRGVVTETSNRKVKSIEPVFIATVEPKRNAGMPPSMGVLKNSNETSPTWIYLVGGARFRVDEVHKTADGAWYQRG